MLYGSQFPGSKAFNPAAFAPGPSRAAGRFRPECTAGLRSLASRSCVTTAISSHRKVRSAFSSRVLQHFQSPELRQPQQYPDQPVRPIDANACQQPRLRWREWRFPAPLYQIGGPRSFQLALKLFLSPASRFDTRPRHLRAVESPRDIDSPSSSDRRRWQLRDAERNSQIGVSYENLLR